MIQQSASVPKDDRDLACKMSLELAELLGRTAALSEEDDDSEVRLGDAQHHFPICCFLISWVLGVWAAPWGL